MSERKVVVLDASFGVKWFKSEAGSEEAREVLALHLARQLHVVVPAQFMCEVVAVASRRGSDQGREVWALLRDADLIVIALDDSVADAAFEQCEALGCSFYDALAPALATLLNATLYTADARAHAQFPGAVVFG